MAVSNSTIKIVNYLKQIRLLNEKIYFLRAIAHHLFIQTSFTTINLKHWLLQTYYSRLFTIFSAKCSSAKCPFGQLSIQPKVRQPNVLSAKCPSARCPTAKCPGTCIAVPRDTQFYV